MCCPVRNYCDEECLRKEGGWLVDDFQILRLNVTWFSGERNKVEENFGLHFRCTEILNSLTIDLDFSLKMKHDFEL